MFGQVVRGHAVQDVFRVAVRPPRLIDDNGRQAGRHAVGHLDVEGHLFIVAAGRLTIEVVQQDIDQGDRGQAPSGTVRGNVVGVIAVKLKQPQHLAGAGQLNVARISAPEVPPQVRATGPGAARGCPAARVGPAAHGPDRADVQARGTRADQVAQSADVKHRYSQLERRFGIRGVKHTVLDRVPVSVQ